MAHWRMRLHNHGAEYPCGHCQDSGVSPPTTVRSSRKRHSVYNGQRHHSLFLVLVSGEWGGQKVRPPAKSHLNSLQASREPTAASAGVCVIPIRGVPADAAVGSREALELFGCRLCRWPTPSDSLPPTPRPEIVKVDAAAHCNTECLFRLRRTVVGGGPLLILTGAGGVYSAPWLWRRIRQ